VESGLATSPQSAPIASRIRTAHFAAGHDVTLKLEIMGYVAVQILLGKGGKELRSNS
jgi:hypothetical protein